MLFAIVAQSLNRVIADETGIPWQGDVPRDLAHFRASTEGLPIVMGRKMYDELEVPLENRRNIVLSRSSLELRDGFEQMTYEDVLILGKEERVAIAGGGAIYRLFWNDIDELIVTTIEAEFEGIVHFPEISDEFELVSSEKHKADAENAYAMQIDYLKRKV